MIGRRLLIAGGLASAIPFRPSYAWFDKAAGRQKRVENATLWLKVFNKILDAIPTLSPSEEEWVVREFKESWLDTDRKSFTPRFNRLAASKEFNIRFGRIWITRLTLCLRLVNMSNDVRSEVAQWARFAEALTDTGTNNLFKLYELGVIPQSVIPINMGDRRLERRDFDAYVLTVSNNVLEHVVRPYLEGELPA